MRGLPLYRTYITPLVCEYFDTVVPVAALLQQGRNLSIVPDACMPQVALPDIPVQIGHRDEVADTTSIACFN